jgi:hypothetical protein
MDQLFSWFKSPAKPRLTTKDLEGVAQYIASGKCKNIVIMSGAGLYLYLGSTLRADKTEFSEKFRNQQSSRDTGFPFRKR